MMAEKMGEEIKQEAEKINMNKAKIDGLYEHFKNTPKKLKIVCDWDEVIQATEPYCLYLATKKRGGVFDDNFEKGFKLFWEEESMEYSLHGSELKEKNFDREVVRN